MVLCANKADLLAPEGNVNEKTINDFASRNEFVAGYLCSSKTGMNTNEALYKLVENIILRSKNTDGIDAEIKKNAARKLEPTKHKVKGSKCC